MCFCYIFMHHHNQFFCVLGKYLISNFRYIDITCQHISDHLLKVASSTFIPNTSTSYFQKIVSFPTSNGHDQPFLPLYGPMFFRPLTLSSHNKEEIWRFGTKTIILLTINQLAISQHLSPYGCIAYGTPTNSL